MVDILDLTIFCMYLRKIRYGKKHHCVLCAVETNGGCDFAKYDVFLDQHSVPVIKQSHITVRFRAGIRCINTLIRTKFFFIIRL